MRRTYAMVAVALAIGWSTACVEVSGPEWEGWDWRFPRDTAGQVRQEFDWRGNVEPGNAIEIKGVFGDVRATLAPGSEVIVKATKIGQPGNVSLVDIEVVAHSNGITICAVYPDVPGHQPNQCVPGDGGNMSVRDSANGAVEVEFDVQVPAGVVFVGRSLTGDVVATNLESDAFINTMFGDARVSTTGLATAKTMWGSIIASVGLSHWGRDLEFSTTTGDIVVTIPAATAAEVEATALSGHIESDFPLDHASPGGMRGTIGGGGPTLRLATLAGNITLRRGS